ncbi:MAG: hypothetical protein HC848_03165 [Limnobacter sp.]|nr:hypothetical protein [Limnobacter sp.]
MNQRSILEMRNNLEELVTHFSACRLKFQNTWLALENLEVSGNPATKSASNTRQRHSRAWLQTKFRQHTRQLELAYSNLNAQHNIAMAELMAFLDKPELLGIPNTLPAHASTGTPAPGNPGPSSAITHSLAA